MPPTLVVCRCCECGCKALAVCPTCELAQLEGVLARRGVVARDGHPALAAYNALLDAFDADDRARDAADAWMGGAA